MQIILQDMIRVWSQFQAAFWDSMKISASGWRENLKGHCMLWYNIVLCISQVGIRYVQKINNVISIT